MSERKGVRSEDVTKASGLQGSRQSVAEDREGIIRPGECDWFSADDFEGYLWGCNDRVILSLIISKRPGCGNLSKLFNAIWSTGRTVAVPTPFAHMREILMRKGFQPTVDDGCEVWIKEPKAGTQP